MFADITPDLKARMPELRGKLDANAPTAPLSWFRTGGPAQVLFTPADTDDLAYFLRRLDRSIPVLVVGLGSNLLIRDGGLEGIVIRLGKGFAEVSVEPGCRIRAGAGAPDVKVARAAAEAGIAGLSFLRGIPGAIGGALRMNGGAYGGETKDVLVEARGVTRSGEAVAFTNAQMGFTYRHSGVPDDVIFTEALFEGRPGEPEEILAPPSRTLPAARPGSWSTPPGAGACAWATPRCRRCTATSSSITAPPRRPTSRAWARKCAAGCGRCRAWSSNGKSSGSGIRPEGLGIVGGRRAAPAESVC
jgi:hypothetical protein